MLRAFCRSVLRMLDTGIAKGLIARVGRLNEFWGTRTFRMCQARPAGNMISGVEKSVVHLMTLRIYAPRSTITQKRVSPGLRDMSCCPKRDNRETAG
jgi:hypothetical protein